MIWIYTTYGIEEEGPVPPLDDFESDGIVVQPPTLPGAALTLVQENILDREVHEDISTEFGIPQYIRACQYRSLL